MKQKRKKYVDSTKMKWSSNLWNTLYLLLPFVNLTIVFSKRRLPSLGFPFVRHMRLLQLVHHKLCFQKYPVVFESLCSSWEFLQNSLFLFFIQHQTGVQVMIFKNSVNLLNILKNNNNPIKGAIEFYDSIKHYIFLHLQIKYRNSYFQIHRMSSVKFDPFETVQLPPFQKKTVQSLKNPVFNRSRYQTNHRYAFFVRNDDLSSFLNTDNWCSIFNIPVSLNLVLHKYSLICPCIIK